MAGIGGVVGTGYNFTDNSSMVTIAPVIEATTEFDTDAYLLGQLGPKRRDLPSSVVLTVVYCIIFCTGVVGNICTCVVISRNTNMHTATNYYLFSLAISDIATLILGQPIEFFSIWQAYPFPLGEVLCIFKGFLSEVTVYASVLTITAFTIERFVAICYPLPSQTMSKLSRAVKTIAVLWIVAIIFALPYPIHVRIVENVKNPYTNESIPESAQCTIPTEWLPGMIIMLQISTFMFFVAPMTIIAVLYILIGLTLRKSDISRTLSRHNNSSTASSQRKGVIRMLVAVVIAFFVCWAPYHAQRLMGIYIKHDEWTPTLYNIQVKLFDVSGVSYLISSTVNPILYNLMSKKYRAAFKSTVFRCCFKNTRPQNSFRLRQSERSSHLTNSTIIHNPSREGSPAVKSFSRDSSRLNRFSMLSRLTKQSSGGSLTPSLLPHASHNNGSNPGSPRCRLSNGNGVSHKNALEKLASKESLDSNVFVELQSEYHERSNDTNRKRTGRESESSQKMLLNKDDNENKIPDSPNSFPPSYGEVYPDEFDDTCL